ncbi:hypothetical protein FD14_GL001765 [Secundilactobacillus similis DSM 23365 = JCM 2765]|uniref:Uncharacterized protein n=2 Tax=Secundilactobacillus similis TaxID=414682 RepID=A0A0R2F1K2_9LACO|nr:hypothetical protein FD14_GL001765 [Secundilactobacillus similis DSM 23365 = JCM 2765]
MIDFSSHPAVQRAWMHQLGQQGELIEPEAMTRFKALAEAYNRQYGERRVRPKLNHD